MSRPTLVRVRPNLTIFAKRRSIWFTRSPCSVPGSTRLTVTVLPATPANARLSPTVAELGAAQFAASSPPESLLMVPETWTPIFGTLYDPSAVKRVIHPVDVSHQGLVGFCAPTTVHSGTAARSAQ